MLKTEKFHKEHLNVRLTPAEMDGLRRYCEQTQRTQSDVIREFVRGLTKALPSQ